MAAPKQICHMLYAYDAPYLVYIAPGLLSYCPVMMLFIEINDHLKPRGLFSFRRNNKCLIDCSPGRLEDLS